MVRASISINGDTVLYIIRNGSLMAQQHMDGILRPIVVHYTVEIGNEFLPSHGQ